MITLRYGIEADLERLLELIVELAEFEKAKHEVTNTIERMREEGFGDERIFEFVVAESSGRIVGASIFYFRYSTWKGKRIYLEDLIVTETERGKGIGQLLFERTIEIGKERNCTGMMWQVLDWNEPAIEFYKKYNSQLDEEWINCHLQF